MNGQRYVSASEPFPHHRTRHVCGDDRDQDGFWQFQGSLETKLKRWRILCSIAVGFLRDSTLFGFLARNPKRWHFDAASQTLTHLATGGELRLIETGAEKSAFDSIPESVPKSSLRFVCKVGRCEYPFSVQRTFLSGQRAGFLVERREPREIWQVDYCQFGKQPWPAELERIVPPEKAIELWKRLDAVIVEGLLQWRHTNSAELSPTDLMIRGAYTGGTWDAQFCRLVSIYGIGGKPRSGDPSGTWLAEALDRWSDKRPSNQSGRTTQTWKFRPDLHFPQLVNMNTGASFRYAGIVYPQPREWDPAYSLSYKHGLWRLRVAFDVLLAGDAPAWSFRFANPGYQYHSCWQLLLILLLRLISLGLLPGFLTSPRHPPYRLCREAYEDLLDGILFWPDTELPKGPPRVIAVQWQHYGEYHYCRFGRAADLATAQKVPRWRNLLTDKPAFDG